MTHRRFQIAHRIHFSECDPAGIVFYPQYFVLFNDLLEAWIDSLLAGGFSHLIGERRIGLPTVHLEAGFKSVSRMGDDVWLSLDVSRVGSRSLTLSLACTGKDGNLRMRATQTVVTTSLNTHTSIALPADLRDAVQEFVNPQDPIPNHRAKE
jgi:4-hydroxybenzoyl-CoA thioesterase